MKILARADWYCGAIDKYCDKLQDTLSELSGFGDTALEIASGGKSSVTGMDASSLVKIEDMLRDFVYGKNASGGLMGYFSSIAIAISVVFFLISIIQLVTEDRFTPEFLVKFFAKFVISFCIIIWSPTILKTIVEFGTTFSNMAGEAAGEVSGLVSDNLFDVSGLRTLVKNHEAYYYKDVTWPGYPTADAAKNGIKQGAAPWDWAELRDARGLADVWNFFSKNLGFVGQIGPALNLMMDSVLLNIFHIVAMVITLVVMFIVITRVLELYVRGAFLPIAAALMSDDGWKGAGGRYFRKLMSLATQNAVVLVVTNVFGLMAKTTMENEFVRAITSQTGCTGTPSDPHQTLADIAICKACLDEIPAPISLPFFKPMLLCIVICVAGISLMFKANAIVDDLWGAR